MTSDDQIIEPSGRDALHAHFGLSYASYLTLPRSFLQSMPDEWQGKLAALLSEADEAAMEHDIRWPPRDMKIHVELRWETDDHEPEIIDPLADYMRGHRRLWNESEADDEE